jgi:DNA modification methylase
MHIESRPIDSIRPYENNPRLNDDAVTAVAESIRQFNFRQPIVVDTEGVIVIGHTRWRAAKQLGLAEVPVHVADGLSPDQIRALRIADNKTAEIAEWDLDKLGIELKALDGSNLDLDLVALGFDQGELDRLLATDPGEDQGDPDAVPAEQDNVISQPSEVYHLGPHRLMCGDSTSAQNWRRLLEDERGALCFTSPPYAQQRDYEGGIGDWDNLMRGVFAALPLAEQAQVFVNLGLVHRDNEWQPYWNAWIDWMATQGWRRFGWYIWDQGPGLMGDWAGRFAPAHEFIWHFNRQARKPHKTKECKLAGATTGSVMRNADGSMKPATGAGDAIQSHKIPDSVIRIMRHKGAVPGGDHPAVFPVALPLEFYTAYGDSGGIALEPFCGSGTSLIAGSKAGLQVRAMELAPRYCDVARRRWTTWAQANGQDPGPGALA